MNRKDTDAFIKDLDRRLKYEQDAKFHWSGLLNRLSDADQINKEGNSVQRLIAADAADDMGRAQEANLLRSKRPVFITPDEQVKERVSHTNGDAAGEAAFVMGYLQAALRNHLDNNDTPLEDTYDIGHIDPESRRKMTAKAVSFYNMAHPLLAKTREEIDPHKLANDFYVVGNGYDEFSNYPEYGKAADALTEVAQDHGPHHLEPAKGKVKRLKFVEGRF